MKVCKQLSYGRNGGRFKNGWTLLEYCIVYGVVSVVILMLSGQYSIRIREAGNQVSGWFGPGGSGLSVDSLLNY